MYINCNIQLNYQFIIRIYLTLNWVLTKNYSFAPIFPIEEVKLIMLIQILLLPLSCHCIHIKYNHYDKIHNMRIPFSTIEMINYSQKFKLFFLNRRFTLQTISTFKILIYESNHVIKKKNYHYYCMILREMEN